MPLGQDQGIGAVVWSPLGWGRLTGKIRRGQPWPEGSRLHDTAGFAPPVDEERLYRVVDALDAIAAETGKTSAGRVELVAAAPDRLDRADRRAQRGAAGAEPRAVGWNLTTEQVATLDAPARVTRLSVLPVLARAVQRAQSAAGAGWRRVTVRRP